jgi:hypothetical protein
MDNWWLFVPYKGRSSHSEVCPIGVFYILKKLKSLSLTISRAEVTSQIREQLIRDCNYWPNLFKDAKRYVQSCDSCQRMGQPVQSNEMPLHTQVLIEPF